jgi:hypothetical protein
MWQYHQQWHRKWRINNGESVINNGGGWLINNVNIKRNGESRIM